MIKLTGLQTARASAAMAHVELTQFVALMEEAPHVTMVEVSESAMTCRVTDSLGNVYAIDFEKTAAPRILFVERPGREGGS